ncbi:hypothetical protein MLD38_020422 [Melastoma candidum]|uniref:Uncharacterized protein n=1 Tax=Melastoma candidum TaxID=119954 RepID=A0ACB9QFW3_9MYRT|nr:hypothetical protein MLD38_020422 [Melastoma candidum]
MHLFCRPCLAYIASHTHACPCDGHVVTVENSKLLMESNKELAATIGKIFVHCLYHRSGCTWQGPLSECSNHCSGCTVGNSLVFCNLCGSQVLHRLSQEHRQNCPNLQPHAMSSQALGYQNMTSAYAENQQSQEMFRHRQQGQQHYGHLPPRFQMNHQPPVPSQPPTCFLGPQMMQQRSPQCAPSFVGPPDPLQPQFPASLPALHHGQPQLQMLPLYPFTPPPPPPQPQLSYQVQAKEQQHFPRHPPPPPPLAPPLVLSHCAPRPHLQTQPPLQVPHPFHLTVPQRAPHHNFLHPSTVMPPSYEHHSQGVAYDYNRPPSRWQMPLPSVNPQPVPPVQLQPQPIPEMPLHMQSSRLAPPTVLQENKKQSQFPVTDFRFQSPQLHVRVADDTSGFVQQNPMHPFGPPLVPYHLQQPAHPQLQSVASSNLRNWSQNLLGGPNFSLAPSSECSVSSGLTSAQQIMPGAVNQRTVVSQGQVCQLSEQQHNMDDATKVAFPVGSNASELMSKYESKTECPVYSFEGKSEADESQSVAQSKTSTQFVSEDGPPGFENVIQRPRYARSESSVPREVNCSIIRPSTSPMDLSRRAYPQFQEPRLRGRSPFPNGEMRTDGLGPFPFSGHMGVGSNRQCCPQKANHDTVEGFQSGPQVQGHQNVAADIARDVKLENLKRRKIG